MSAIKEKDHTNTECDLNDYLIKRLNELFADPVQWLAFTLDIRKVTAYRRMSGKVRFNLDEFSILARNIDLSLEDFRRTESPSIIKNLPHYIFKQIVRYYENLSKFEKVENLMAGRRTLFLPYWYESENIFKLFCYKFMHRITNSIQEIKNSITEDLTATRNSLASLRKQVKSTNECIIYKNLFDTMISDIQYFRLCRLLSEEDLEGIRNDLHSFLDRLTTLMKNGFDEAGNRYVFYLSLVDVESDLICSTLDNDKIYSLLWRPENYDVEWLRTGNQYRKRWINMMKRYTQVITQSNEMLRSDFIDKQRSIIDRIGKDNVLI